MSGLALVVAGVAVSARPSGALWIEAHGALIVADAHFEKGSAYASRGQLLPPYDTTETLLRLESEAEALSPSIIVFLGDAWHDGGAEARLAPVAADRIAALARGRTLVWIAGNHDPAGPKNIPGEHCETLSLDGLVLVHEPSDPPARGELAGHLHPCARVASVGRRRCFITDGQRMILPAFGAYAGGLNVRDPAIRGRLGPRKLAAVLGAGRVHAIPWSALKGD
ncbi:MAG TPA: ligase-associated DNA damage response endonuclease PdeM [Caulobacteraceae bacterium]